MSDTKDKFPPDDDLAEKGSFAEPASPDARKNEPYEEFNRNAKTWAIYLQEAEENAKNQAEVWKTGLESLLIFAGLFAGVITSFLAESRKKLRLEDSEALLMDIRSALRNEPVPTVAHQPSSDQLWVNGLWFTSLLVTLFSAIVAVLARSWLVNHLPISNRKEAVDAYKRWMLDERAERWKLEKVITGIPLLVQLAFFLFSLGLGIQTYQDNRMLGIVVLSLVAGGTLLYLVVTVLPLFLPPDSCPFQTPLSEIVCDLKGVFVSWLRRRGGSQTAFAPNAFFDTLVKILYEGLINSGKPELADEAALELIRRPPQPHRLVFLAASNTPAVCVQRIRDCMSMRFDDPTRRDEIISAHLQVLLRLVASWEGNGCDEQINSRFQGLIADTGILGRWDFVPESQRALAYAVRVPLYLTSGQGFEDIDSPGKEWETVVHYIQPTYRLAFVINACRATVQGKGNIQRISSFSVVHLVAQAYLSVHQGRQTEWNLPGYKERVHPVCGAYLERLSDAIGSMWKEVPDSFLSIPSNKPVPIPGITEEEQARPEMLTIPLSAYTPLGFPPPNLLYALTSHELGVRSQANALLVAVAHQGHLESSIMESLLSELFQTMFDLSYTPDTMQQCLETAAKLCETQSQWTSNSCISPATCKEVTIKALSERILKALESNNLFESERVLTVVEKFVDLLTRPGEVSWQAIEGVEEALWIIAPRLIEINLTLKYPSSLKRWQWLSHLSFSVYGEQASRCRNRLQEPLCLALAKAFTLDPGGAVDTQDAMLNQHELLDSLVDLLSLPFHTGVRMVPVLDLETLMQVLAPNVLNIATLALQATDSLTIYRGVALLLALSERWHGIFLWHAEDANSAALPSAQLREEVYKTLKASLASPKASAGFMRHLLNAMKSIARAAVKNSPNEELKASKQGLFREADKTRTQALEPVVVELLQSFIKPRWNDSQAVQVLVDCLSDDESYDMVVACLPEEAKEVWNESKSAFASAVPLVASLIQTLVLRGKHKDFLPIRPLFSTSSLGWSNGVNLLLDLALHNPCIDTRDAAIRSLLFLSKNQESWETILDGIRSRIVMFTGDPQAAEANGEFVMVNWKVLLAMMSTNATARDLCSFVLDSLDNKTLANQALHLPTDPPQLALPAYTKQIEQLGLHSNMRIRQVALEILARTVPESDATSVVKQLIVLAFGEFDESFKQFCLRRMVDLASSAQLLSPLIAAIEEVDQNEWDSIIDVSWRKEWVNLLREVSRHGTYVKGLIALARIAESDELCEVRVAAMQSLSELADGHSEIIVMRTTIARNARLGWRDPTTQALKAWAATLGSLSRMGHWKDGPEVLVNMALYEYDNDVRHQAYCEIDALLAAGGECAASTSTSLKNALHRAIGGNGRYAFLFKDLDSKETSNPLTFGTDLASALWHPIIKQSLADPMGSYHTSDGALVTVANHARSDQCMAILKCVLENLGNSSPHAARTATKMVSLLRRRLKTLWQIDSLAAYLSPLLQHSSNHVRAAALAISSELCLSTDTYSGGTGVIILPLVSMALDDRDDALRIQAIELLYHDICRSGGHGGRELATSLYVHRFLEHMSAPSPLNTTTARLLGVLFQHESAREQIGLWILEKTVVERDISLNLEQGILTLLSELVSKQMLHSHSTLDSLLLLLAASIASKGTPTAESYRPWIFSSLSLHYRKAVFHGEELTRAFEYAAFGRHGTEAEAKAWLAMQQYLKEKPQSLKERDDEAEGTSLRHTSEPDKAQPAIGEFPNPSSSPATDEDSKPSRASSLAMARYTPPSSSKPFISSPPTGQDLESGGSMDSGEQLA